ncbi:Sensor histidine kinase RcsC [compost metagenome]
MGDRHDYVALEWVKGEIAETLKQARQALEAFVENPRDPTRMGFCQAYIHQVRGTLQMVEFDGAALLAEEMEQLVQALIDERTASRTEALEVLMQAILQLPVYLERVQSARRDLPMIVLPLLNDLRAARGEKLLSETSLFSPDLSHSRPALPQDAIAQMSAGELPALLRKLRQTLQVALVGVIRNQEMPTNLGYMAKVFARLETLCAEAPVGRLWPIAAAVVESLANGSLSNGTSMRTLLRQVDHELKRLIEQGVDGMNQPAPEELIKNLLFYVAEASDQSSRVRALKEEYRLAEALPGASVVAEERARLSGPDRDAMRSVVGALCEELVRVKDSLDLFVRSERRLASELEALTPPLKQIADTLAVLGFGQPRRIILDQIDAVSALAHGQAEPGDAALMDIAGALLYVEATLTGMVGPAEEQGGAEGQQPTTDVEQIHQLVIKEARNGLEQAKDAIIEFIASQWNHDYLARVPELLTQVRGGLSMIAQERAATLLEACNRYIQEQLLARRAVPDWSSLDTLADAITGVEYYLERLAEDQGTQGDLILDVAEESLVSLGYSLRPQPEVAAPVAEEAPAPLADPLDEIDVLSASWPEQVADSLLMGEPAQADSAAAAPDSELLVSDDNWTLAEADLPEPREAGVDFSLDLPLELEAATAIDEDASIQSSEPAPAEEPLLVSDDNWTLGETELPEPLEEGIDFSLGGPLEAVEPEAQAAPGEMALAVEPWPEMQPAPAETEAPASIPVIDPPTGDAPPRLLPPPADEEPVDEELCEVFIEEAGEVLETIGEQLPLWLADGEAREALTEVRRAFHTLKGSGRMVRALVIGELAWSIENLLNRVLDRSIAARPAVHQAVEGAVALMPELVAEFAAGAQRQRDDVDALAASAHALASGQLPQAPAPVETPALAEPAPELVLDEGLDPQLLEIFRNEAEAHLETLDAFLADCERELPQPVTDDLQRALHTLKGSAHMAGILPIAEVATPLERLVKYFKTNLLQVDLREAELLRDAARLFRSGLEQLLGGRPLAPIEGSETLLEQIALLQLERQEAAEEQRRDERSEGSDPQMIGVFLAEGMDILLDAEDLLGRWREHPGELTELGALLDELATLGRGARMAELPQMAELGEALQAVYEAVRDGQLAVDETFFGVAEQAHEALIGMMDQVAAALQVTPRPEQVQALRQLLESGGLPALEEEDFLDLDSFTAEDFPAEDEELLLLPRDTAREDLPDGLAWPLGPDSALAAEDDVLVRAFARRQQLAPLQQPPAIDDEMVSIFLDEAVDLLESAGQALEQWLRAPEAAAALHSLQRDLHTLKGGARMADIREIGDLAHELESLYEGFAEQRHRVSPALAGLLQGCHDRLATQVEQLRSGAPLADPGELIEAIRAFRETPVVDADLQPEAVPEEAPVPEELPVAEVMAAEPVAGVDDLPPEHDQELVDIFLEEGFDILESAAGALQRWMLDIDNSLELEALQRDLHTLKGGARMAEIRPVGDLAHELEFLYEGLSAGRLRASPALFELLQRCHDCLADMLEAVYQRRSMPEGEPLVEAIRQFRASPDEQLGVPPSVALTPAAAPAPQAEGGDIEEIFLEEADDLLELMERVLGRWDGERDGAALDELLRILHTLKGGARLAGQGGLGDLAHDLEQHLVEAQQRGAPWPESLLLDAQSGFEGLQAAVDELRRRIEADESAIQAAEEAPILPEAIMAPSEVQVSEAPPVLPFVRRAQEAAQEAAARRAPQELVKVPAPLLENLVNLAGETSIFRGRVEQQVSDVGATLVEMEATIERVRDQLRRLDIETQAQILSRHQADAERAGYEDFDPLEMDRYSQLQQLSRALFESASDLFDLKETLAAKNRDAETLLLQQARVNTELQEGLMRTRMVPFDRLVPRLRRIVRQVASELGKQVEFVVSNAEGEMDRSVLERIVAPLEHMLRNAVDHGIESSEARRLAGKPELGSIRLNLAREGGDILLTLADDGAGIRLDAVRRKAIERGLMSADSDLTDHEVLQFILEAGFSTAEKVTQISGRGVGLDVANAEVKQLGGSVSIHSNAGDGTRFNIRLPFTVSVNRALMVLSGEDLYALPLNTIEGIVRVSPYELEALYEQQGEEGGAPPRFEYAGQSYELKYLGDLLNNGQHPKLVGQSLPLPVILVRSAEHAVAVQVDALAGSREIVVKSLGPQFAGVNGISGATILGDGRVVVILDLLATIRARHAHAALQARPRRVLASDIPLEGEYRRPTLVMVVDDSVTVRKVTSRLLERNGMNVVTAKDGVDAIAQLQEHKPDIMLLDIEMPRMDGFEVATLVRHDEQLKDLPIVMITSRTGEKHRERALAIGVNQYLGKPYQESELLDAIQRLVKTHG